MAVLHEIENAILIVRVELLVRNVIDPGQFTEGAAALLARKIYVAGIPKVPRLVALVPHPERLAVQHKHEALLVLAGNV